MSFTLKPYVEALANSDKENDAELAPARAGEMKAKLELEVAQLNIRVKELTNRISIEQRKYPLNVNGLLDAVDQLALTERRQQQIESLVKQMFPTA